MGTGTHTGARGPPSMFFSVDGGRSRISMITTQAVLPSTFLSVDGVRSRIYSSSNTQGPAVDVS
jgi:hypothetical protein